MTDPVRLLPLGGLGEFGLHMMVVEYRDDIVVIDCGFMFPDDEMPGVNYAIPDFTYLLARKDAVRGIFLTHTHYDHIGAVPYLLREFAVPVYGTPLTLGILTKFLRERKVEGADLRRIQAGNSIAAGSMTVEALRVTHSVADGLGFIVHTPAGSVVHTGDFKLDNTPVDDECTDIRRLAELGDENVLCLLSDSTNAERPGRALSEREVGHAFQRLFERASRRIIVATFATHIHRIQQLIDVATRFGRKVALLGRSMVGNVKVAQDLGYLSIADGVLVDIADLRRWSPERQLIISTGSQGEPYSAIALMSSGQHTTVNVEAGDSVMISARVIPGNERHVAKVISDLFRLGADVLYDGMDFVHVSGHAFRDDLRTMIDLVRPRYFVPVHGELRYLVQHGRIAEAAGLPRDRIFVIENGTALALTAESAQVMGPFPSGRVYVDGIGVGDVGAAVLRDRRLLGEEGTITVTIARDRSTGTLRAGPEIVCRGFVYVKENGPLIDELKSAVSMALADRGDELPASGSEIETTMRTTVRQFVSRRFKRKPVVLTTILEV